MKNEKRKKKERKDEYVGVGGKGAYMGSIRFFVFFWVLPITAFLKSKNAAIG